MKQIKPKLYHVQIGSEQMLIRAKTKAGAIAHAAQKLVACALASQETLVALTKAGVEAVDAVDPDADLVGERSVNAAAA